MQPNITGASATVTITVEAGEWLAAATLQLGAENICGHSGQDNGALVFVIPT
jgi:hypothetical protein